MKILSINESFNFQSMVAYAYLIILPLAIRISGQIYLQDIFVPIMGLFCLFIIWKNPSEIIKTPFVFLSIFIFTALLSTMFNYSGILDLYEISIFMYMFVLVIFFANVKLSGKFLYFYGLAVLSIMLIYCFSEFFLGEAKVYKAYSSSTLDFISRRFYFTFNHPNLTGSFYALPFLCLILGAKFMQSKNYRRIAIMAFFLLIFAIPLVLTASKHMLISIALFLGAISASTIWPKKLKNSIRYLCYALVSGIFIFFLLTVFFPFFPLNSEFPYFNCSTPGMYTIHQDIYAKSLCSGWKTLFLGCGKENMISIYPAMANYDYVHIILAQYKQEFLMPNFISYMDAHNEYLNIGVSFGIISLISMYLFWFFLPFHNDTRSAFAKNIILFFIISIFMVSFWDDILSKRWIWCAAGIIYSFKDRENESL